MARKSNEVLRCRVDKETKRAVRKLARKTLGGESAVVRKAIERHLEELGVAA